MRFLTIVVALLECFFVAFTQDAANSEPSLPISSMRIHSTPTADSDHVESHVFQAEVTRLMDIIINSLYSDKEVFLRELVSNAADALERVRHLMIVDGSEPFENLKQLEIYITADPENNILSIRDTGVGMTKKELVGNLGTVAKSGTTNFLEALAAGADVNIIGQFGVGFYSAFLVADKVTVISKHNNEGQHIWVSSADGQFSVFEDPEGDTLKRGTEILLHMKEDSKQFLQTDILKRVLMNYSQFINFPIYVLNERTKTVDLEVEDDSELDLDEEDEPAPKKKIVQEKVQEKYWEHTNPQKPIWLRPKEDVSEEEYINFYRVLTNEPDGKPRSHVHFHAEGEIDFRALLYIPQKSVSRWGNNPESFQQVKLYVRRVLITNDAADVFPRWLPVKGVVDSNDLPIKVDRETLTASKAMESIAKKTTKKVAETIKKMSKESFETKRTEREKMTKEEQATRDAMSTVERKTLELSERTEFERLWSEYHRYFQMGCVEDESNRKKIASFLRFRSMKHPEDWNLITLDEYIEEMADGQKDIYYLAGNSVARIENSPHLAMFRQLGYDVLYLVDPSEEPCLLTLFNYEGHTLNGIEKGDLDLLKERGADKFEVYQRFSPLVEWWEARIKAMPAPPVGKIKMSNRLVDAPVAISHPSWGYSAHAEQMIRAQATVDESILRLYTQERILELNPQSSIIMKLTDMAKADEKGEEIGLMVDNLLEVALLASGYEVLNPGKLSEKLYYLLGKEIGVDAMATEVWEEGDYFNIPPSEFKPSEKAADEPSMEELARQYGLGLNGEGMDGLDFGSMGMDDAIRAAAESEVSEGDAEIDDINDINTDADETVSSEKESDNFESKDEL